MMQTAQKLTRSFATAGALSMSYISTAFAQGFAGDTPDLGLPEASNPDEVREVIVSVIEAILNFLALVAVIVIIIAGIRLIVSQGEEEQKEKAKKTIFYAIIGLVIILFARVIVSLVTVYLADEVGGAGGGL